METSPLLPFLIPVDYNRTVNSGTVNISTDLFDTFVPATGKLYQRIFQCILKCAASFNKLSAFRLYF